MDVAHNRSLGFAGKEILFRKVEFERYRKPHVVEYPRSAIVLNPQHTRQLKDSLQHTRHQREGEEEDGDEAAKHESDSDSDDDDDPRRIDKATQLCSDAQLRSSLHLRWQNIAPVGLGLVNLGNTCFANSVLQALAHIPALAQYFTHTFRSADNQLGAPFDFAFALAETFRRMHPTGQSARGGGGGGAYRPGQIMGNLRLLSKHFSIGRQSDAHEFAVQLLFACQRSLLHRLMGSKKAPPRVAHTTALYRICGGYLLSQVTWSRQEEIQQLLRAGKQQAAADLKMEAKQALLQQQEKQPRRSRHGLDVQTLYSNTYDPFTILSVELAGQTLQHCLDKFCLAEELDGRCYHSPREVGVRAKKKFSIHVPPPVLIIHLKRFGPTGNKINKHVRFPLELDITRYCTPQSTASASPPEHGREDCQYELNAICVHEGGSINYGHYYTMAKASNSMWYEFNDSHVSRLSDEQLQRAQAYMLCYSRVVVAKKPQAVAAATPARPSTGPKGDGVAAALQSMKGRPSLLLPSPAPVESEGGIGRELTDREVQALMEKRRRDAQAAADAARSQDEGEEEGDAEEAPQTQSQSAEHAPNGKRQREELPTESDDDDDDEARDGAYVRRLRPAPGHRLSAAESNGTAHDGEGVEEEEEEEERRASPPAKTSMYGGLIKSMKRLPNGRDAVAAAAPPHGKASDAHTTNGRPAPRHGYHVGRHAVNTLQARKLHDTPDSVRRPMTAPKFQQRIRDPMWEMEMDRGKVKKVKSKEKAPDPFEGTNPFQEVSRGMFDIRGRRRRE